MIRKRIIISGSLALFLIIGLILINLSIVEFDNLFMLVCIFCFVLWIFSRLHTRTMNEHLFIAQSCQEKLNLLNSELRTKEKLLDTLPGQINKLNFFKNLIDQLIQLNELDDVYKIIASEIKAAYSDVDTILIYLLNRGTLRLAASFKKNVLAAPIKHKKGDILDYWVLKQNKELLIEDLPHDFRFDLKKIESLDERSIRSLIASPMYLGKKTIGMIRVESSKERKFSYDDLRILSVLADIAALSIDRLRLFEKVQDLAIKDSLTGLYLKGYFTDRLKQEMSRISVNDKKLSLIMLDIDHFKQVNDQYGHVVGDMVIKKVAHTLHSVVAGSGYVVSRFGGEEFVIMLPEASKEKALTIAENLRVRIEAEPILFRRKKITYTVSVGVATFPENAKYAKELLQACDDALYQAKEKGRNQVCSA